MTVIEDRVAAGHAALHAALRTIEGTPTTLADHLADPLIVFAWASW